MESNKVVKSGEYTFPIGQRFFTSTPIDTYKTIDDALAKFEDREFVSGVKTKFMRFGLIGWHNEDGVCYFIVDCKNAVGVFASHFDLMFETMEEAMDRAKQEQEALGYWPVTVLPFSANDTSKAIVLH